VCAGVEEQGQPDLTEGDLGKDYENPKEEMTTESERTIILIVNAVFNYYLIISS